MSIKSTKLFLYLYVLLISFCFFIISVDSAFAECPDSMTAYWKLDETSSGMYYDLCGTNDGGCHSGCPSATSEGIVNIGQIFDLNTGGINISADTSYNWDQYDSFTIEFWMKRDPGNLSENEVVVGRVDIANNLKLWAGIDTNGIAAFELIAKNGDGSGSANILHGDSILTDGQWHHVVLIRRSNSNQNFLYVDGQLKDSKSVNYSDGFDSDIAGLNIGWLDLDAGHHFNGTIDEVALYREALPQTEIIQHYNDGLVGLRWGYYACNQPAKIMPVGNSITMGWNTTISDFDYMVGYRQKLYLDLQGRGYDIDFVGSQQDGRLAEPFFDYDHEGHPGWGDGDIAANIYDFLVANPADVGLLHIGTNGLNPDPSDVENILNEIDLYICDRIRITSLSIRQHYNSY